MATEREGLTPEEIALLDELDQEIAAEGGGDDADETDEAARVAAEEAAAAAKKTAEEETARKAVEEAAKVGDGAGKGKDDEAAAPADKPAIRLEADDTAAKAKLDELTGKRAELRKKYNDGELDREAYDTQADALADQIADAKAEVNKAAMYRDITEKAARQQWNDAVDSFMADKDNAAFRADGPLHLVLDAKVREMNSNAEVVAKFPNHLARLNEAKRLVLESTRKALGLPDAAPAKPAAPGKQPPKVEIPPSVDDVPPAGDERENEFAHIDRLPPAQREAALAKLTPDQYDRYLAGT